MVREGVGRTAEPTACVIEAQSVKIATSVPTDTQGTDAGKKIVGRKCSRLSPPEVSRHLPTQEGRPAHHTT